VTQEGSLGLIHFVIFVSYNGSKTYKYSDGGMAELANAFVIHPT
jgi:hypothetical protein